MILRPSFPRALRTPLAALAAALTLALACGVTAVRAQVGGIAPKFLIDPASPKAAGQLKPSTAQVTAVPGKDGITVTIQPGDAGYPGFTIHPAQGETWDLGAFGRIDAGHVVDDQRHRESGEHRGQRHQLRRLHEDLDVPAQAGHLVRQGGQHLRRGRSPRLRSDEVHAQSAHALRRERVELGVGHLMADDGHAARLLAQLRECIERAGVVRAVGRGIDHDRARGAQPLLQLAIGRHIGMRRLALPVRRRRETRVEDVHVAVAGILGQGMRGPVDADGMGNRSGFRHVVHGVFNRA